MKKHVRTALLALVCAGVLTLLAGLGVLRQVESAAADAFYQTLEPQDGEIVLVGIDERAEEELGPYNQWGRDIIADVIATLNADEDCRPAVIVLDVLYTAESDPDLDEYLAEMAGLYGNVVTASAAEFGIELVPDGAGDYRLDTNAILGYEEPYEALRAVTTQGHINCKMDTDGYLRHHMLTLTLPDGTEVPSLALAAADLYRSYLGEAPVERPPVKGGGFWYLPFSGVPGDFNEDISVATVLDGELEPEFFADRIVLVGPYASAMQDAFFTSADHASQMYGMEVHANAIQALLRGRYYTEVGNGVQLAVLFVLLLAAFWAFWRRKVTPATVVWLVLAGGWVGLCKLLQLRGLLLHVLWVPVGVTILYVGCIAFNYISAALEKRRVTNTFKRYVDPSVIHELLREDSDSLGLGGKLVDIAVLFVDIRGFTTMSEVLTPPQVVEILNQYLTLTTKSVMDNHGTLDKFVGDCTMAIWNAPLPQEDYVMNACKAAMAMVKGSAPLAEKLQAEFGRTVSFGVGVNVGPAVVGNIGAPMRMDYTAIGDTVNTAARLEANAPGGTVYISRAVADALEGRIKATPLAEPIKLKGKADGFEILTLDEIL